MQDAKIIFVMLGMTVFLAGCSSSTTLPEQQFAPTTAAMTSWPDRQHALNNVTAWQLQGVVGIQQDTKHWSASLNWQQQSISNYNIRLYGPFGAGAMQLHGQPGLVTLVSNNNPKPITASSAEQLITNETGWPLPVTNLYYWVRSLPAPGTTSKISLDNTNRLSTLQQDGWNIQYLDYSNINGLDLPDKMLLTNAHFSIKLIIKNWQF